MDESIRLDRKSFEALAGDTRVKVLKSLLRRRKTLTELSHELGLSASTMKEHLDVLVGSELAVQVDEGRKWKYYELTRKGKSIVQPHELRVWIVLGLSMIAAGAAVFNLFYALQPNAANEEYLAIGEAMASAPEDLRADEGGAATSEETFAAQEAAVPAAEKSGIPFLDVGIAAAAILVLAWALMYARRQGAL